LIAAWRVCRAPYADLSGEGAKRLGGRWNGIGQPVAYLAEHPALAVLEVLVHLDLPPDLLPEDYVLLGVDLPDEPPACLTALPTDTVAAGDRWLRDLATAVMRVPSVLIPSATNLLLNPLHPRAAEARITHSQPFAFDPRLLRGGGAATPPRPL
jgi:RES domain-containing protein